MTKATRSDRSPLKVVVTLLAIAVVVVYAMAGFQIRENAEGYRMDYDARDYIYSAEMGRFGDLYEVAVRDMDKHAAYSSEVAECRALAFYYEQAVLEHAYRTTGDTEKADQFAKRMEEYEPQLGSLSAKAEVVKKAVTP